MPRTYDTAFTADISEVRLLIADTSEKNAFFKDAEVTKALTEGGSVKAAAAYLLRVLATAALRRGDPSSVYTGLLALADQYDPVIAVLSTRLPALMPFDSEYSET